MNHQKSGYLYLLATLIFFSTYEVVSKTLVGKIGPYEINFIRFLIGGGFLFLVLVVKKDVRISPRDLFLSTVVGILNVVISMSLAQLSIFCEGAKASVVAVIFSANPIFVMLFSALFNKERLSVNKLLGFVFGVAGLAVIFLEKGDFRFANYASPLLALSSALVFGLYTVLGGKVASRMGSLKMNAYSFIFGSLVLLPLVFATGGSFSGIDPSGIPQLAYLAVCVTGAAYLFYFKGLSITGAATGSLVFFGKPVVASFFAILLLGERFTLHLAAGTALILVGIGAVLYWETLAARLAERIRSSRRS